MSGQGPRKIKIKLGGTKSGTNDTSKSDLNGVTPSRESTPAAASTSANVTGRPAATASPSATIQGGSSNGSILDIISPASTSKLPSFKKKKPAGVSSSGSANNKRSDQAAKEDNKGKGKQREDDEEAHDGKTASEALTKLKKPKKAKQKTSATSTPVIEWTSSSGEDEEDDSQTAFVSSRSLSHTVEDQLVAVKPPDPASKGTAIDTEPFEPPDPPPPRPPNQNQTTVVEQPVPVLPNSQSSTSALSLDALAQGDTTPFHASLDRGSADSSNPPAPAPENAIHAPKQEEDSDQSEDDAVPDALFDLDSQIQQALQTVSVPVQDALDVPSLSPSAQLQTPTSAPSPHVASSVQENTATLSRLTVGYDGVEDDDDDDEDDDEDAGQPFDFEAQIQAAMRGFDESMPSIGTATPAADLDLLQSSTRLAQMPESTLASQSSSLSGVNLAAIGSTATTSTSDAQDALMAFVGPAKTQLVMSASAPTGSLDERMEEDEPENDLDDTAFDLNAMLSAAMAQATIEVNVHSDTRAPALLPMSMSASTKPLPPPFSVGPSAALNPEAQPSMALDQGDFSDEDDDEDDEDDEEAVFDLDAQLQAAMAGQAPEAGNEDGSLGSSSNEDEDDEDEDDEEVFDLDAQIGAAMGIYPEESEQAEVEKTASASTGGVTADDLQAMLQGAMRQAALEIEQDEQEQATTEVRIVKGRPFVVPLKPRIKPAIVDDGDPENAFNRARPAHYQALPYAYSCSFQGCDRVFSRPENLRSHQMNHFHKLPFPCFKCPLAFSNNQDLCFHLRSHDYSRSWRYRCRGCHNLFAEKAMVDIHATASPKNSRCSKGETEFELRPPVPKPPRIKQPKAKKPEKAGESPAGTESKETPKAPEKPAEAAKPAQNNDDILIDPSLVSESATTSVQGTPAPAQAPAATSSTPAPAPPAPKAKPPPAPPLPFIRKTHFRDSRLLASVLVTQLGSLLAQQYDRQKSLLAPGDPQIDINLALVQTIRRAGLTLRETAALATVLAEVASARNDGLQASLIVARKAQIEATKRYQQDQARKARIGSQTTHKTSEYQRNKKAKADALKQEQDREQREAKEMQRLQLGGGHPVPAPSPSAVTPQATTSTSTPQPTISTPQPAATPPLPLPVPLTPQAAPEPAPPIQTESLIVPVPTMEPQSGSPVTAKPSPIPPPPLPVPAKKRKKGHVQAMDADIPVPNFEVV